MLWSAGNEIPEQVPPRRRDLRRLIEIFHREDPSRLVTAACERIALCRREVATLQEFLELLDVVGYNYGERGRDREEKYYSVDRHAFPQRRFIGTENPSMAIGDYSELLPASALSRAAARQSRADIEQLWKFARTYDYVCGDHMWTGIDYLGEVRVACEELGLWRAGYLRLRKGRLLFLSEPVDG